MGHPRILLAESHAGVARRLRSVLEQDGRFDVVAMVKDGFGLVGAAQALKPDVIVADVAMSGLDGIEAATEVLRGNPAVRVVFVTVHNEPEVVKRAFDAGAAGYVMKLTAGDELVAAVQASLRGEHYASPGVFAARPSAVER